jgi:hypothetical protein
LRRKESLELAKPFQRITPGLDKRLQQARHNIVSQRIPNAG